MNVMSKERHHQPKSVRAIDAAQSVLVQSLHLERVTNLTLPKRYDFVHLALC